MTVYLIKRGLAACATLFLVLTVTFILLQAIPGGPFDSDRELPPEIVANLEQKYHMAPPNPEHLGHWFWQQYTAYLGRLVHGDLGPSLKYLNRDVTQILAESFPVSAQLALATLCLIFTLALTGGTLASLHPGKKLDHTILALSSLFVSLPSFVRGIVLIYLFAFALKLLPPALWEGPTHWILPVLTLSLAPTAYLARLLRSKMIETAHEDFIRTARAKGLGLGAILLKHNLKNSLLPVITVLGPLTAGLITGSFVVETIFSIPGMGRHFVTAILDRDYFLVMGLTLIYASVLILLNLIVDILYGWIDPRIRLEKL